MIEVVTLSYLFVIFKQKNPTENGYQLYEEAFIPAE